MQIFPIGGVVMYFSNCQWCTSKLRCKDPDEIIYSSSSFEDDEPYDHDRDEENHVDDDDEDIDDDDADAHDVDVDSMNSYFASCH